LAIFLFDFSSSASLGREEEEALFLLWFFGECVVLFIYGVLLLIQLEGECYDL
jgi:hypothetical protein